MKRVVEEDVRRLLADVPGDNALAGGGGPEDLDALAPDVDGRPLQAVAGDLVAAGGESLTQLGNEVFDGTGPRRGRRQEDRALDGDPHDFLPERCRRLWDIRLKPSAIWSA